MWNEFPKAMQLISDRTVLRITIRWAVLQAMSVSNLFYLSVILVIDWEQALLPVYRQRNRNSKKLHNLPNVIQLKKKKKKWNTDLICMIQVYALTTRPRQKAELFATFHRAFSLQYSGFQQIWPGSVYQTCAITCPLLNCWYYNLNLPDSIPLNPP